MMRKINSFVFLFIFFAIHFQGISQENISSNKKLIHLIGTKWQSKGEFCTDTIEFTKVETCKIYHCELDFSCNASYYNYSMYGREEVAFEGDTLIITETDDCNPNTENIINALTIICSKVVVTENILTFISTYSLVISREGGGIISETKPKKMFQTYIKIKK